MIIYIMRFVHKPYQSKKAKEIQNSKDKIDFFQLNTTSNIIIIVNPPKLNNYFSISDIY